MPCANPETTTALLAQVREGGDRGAEARNRLLPLVYEELRDLAEHYMRAQNPAHTLQTTALVNEAYIRLVAREAQGWESRAHFIGVAAKAMRSVLVDHARRRKAGKRGGARRRVPLEGAAILTEDPSDDLLAIDEALSRLSATDEQKGRVVELRFFGGLTNDEAASVLGVSSATVKREWRFARAWLYNELTGEIANDS
jgi:RNA polymerase sigma factor (TIGR02999 family)